MVQKSSMTNNNCHALITLVYRRACSNPTKDGQFLVRELTLKDLELIPQLGKRSLQPSTETPQLLNCTTGQPILIWQFDFLLCFHLFEMILIYHKHAMLEQAKLKLCLYMFLPSSVTAVKAFMSTFRFLKAQVKWIQVRGRVQKNRVRQWGPSPYSQNVKEECSVLLH